MFDVITIGSATMDAFIETDAAKIVSVTSMKDSAEFMAYPYGAKIEIDNFKSSTGGGAVNTATNFSNLGLKTSTIIKIGSDNQGKTVVDNLVKFKVDTSNVKMCNDSTTGFSVILTSFQGDRTVLAHRGPNATITTKDINFDAIKKSKWLYIAPLNGHSREVLDEIAVFAEENGVKTAINLGTSSIKQGVDKLAKVLSTAEVITMNLEEASMLTGIKVRPDTKEEKFSRNLVHPDVMAMLKSIKASHPKIVMITDGKNGVYAYDGNTLYRCPEFPANVVSTLGAGDAFSSTFVASLMKTNNNIEKSLKYASINAAAAVSKFGAQEGFLTFSEIEKKLNESPDFVVDKCHFDITIDNSDNSNLKM
ncbi:MAG: carbohydrate kinase family protein [Candidatus Gastranaerophilales bacterium]|nr:carbohydrate kinase family protein [Candidatus Gastranaerophilales bacterium]